MRKHLLILTLAATLPYAPFLGNPLIWDDRNLLVVVKFTHNLGNARYLLSPDLPAMWPDGPYWRPLAALSFMVDHTLWGMSPIPRRGFNLLVHVLTTGLVYELVRSMARRQDVALIVALLFACHPVQGENIFGISYRQGSVATMCVLLGLWCYRRWSSSQTFLSSGAGWLSLLALAIGSGFKELVVVFPALLWFHDRFGLHPDASIRPRWVRYAPFIVYLAAYWLYRSHVLSLPVTGGGGLATTWAGGVKESLLTLPKVLWEYARLAVWPYPLTVDHAVTPVVSVEPAVLCGVALLAIYVWWMHRTWRRQPLAAFGLVWMGLTLLPTLHLVPGTVSSFVAERYAYLPAAGLALSGAGWLSRVSHEKLAQWRPVLIGLCSIFALITVGRGSEWREPLRFYQLNAVRYPLSCNAHYWLGFYLQQEGRLEEAKASFERALAISSEWSPAAHHNFGMIYLKFHDLEKAGAAFENARRLDPRNPGVYLSLGNVEFMRRRFDLARSWYRQALTLNPQYEDAKYMLALTLKRSSLPRRVVR